MPRLWSDSVDAHRRAVRDATIDATAALVAEQGLAGVTMSGVAARAGIGRATLYKHFPSVESILQAWHERQVAEHLQQLESARASAQAPAARLRAVLQAYADLAQGGHSATGLASALHRGEHVSRAHQHLQQLVAEVIAEGAAAGALRRDVPPHELAAFCLHALAAADAAPTKAAVGRLVEVTLSALSEARPAPV